MKRSDKWVLFVVTALVAIGAGSYASLHREVSARAAGPSPAAELFYAQRLPDATGVERAMSEHRGKVVVVNFWATWCAPCVEEIPTFSRVHAEHTGQVAFVGLGIDSPSNIAGFNTRFKPSYPLLVAGAGGTELARAFGDAAGALPYTIVLGPDGSVIASRLGRVDEATLQKWIAPFVTPAKRPSAAADRTAAPS
jgi:thiol-disulfide isomerase/thioredoxin